MSRFNRKMSVLALVGGAFLAARTTPAFGQIELQKLVTTDTVPGSLLIFGKDIAISGDRAVVGAIYRDPFEIVSSGFVYVYRHDAGGWLLETRLSPPDGAPTKLFGSAVDVSADFIVVGVPFDAGMAYVFRREGTAWLEDARLTPAGGSIDNAFGFSVAIAGDVIVVGAHVDDEAGPDAGAVYVFRRTNGQWIQEAKLTAGDASGFAWFGRALSLDGSTVLVGSPFDDPAGNSAAGSAYVFQYDGTRWIEEQKLVGSDTSAGDQFGESLRLAGDCALIRAPYYDDPVRSIYVFRRDGSQWMEQPKLVPGDVQGVSFFAIALSRDFALLGNGSDDTVGADSGAAYLFSRAGRGWTQVAKLIASDAAAGDEFGGFSAVGDGFAFIGSEEPHPGDVVGSVYVFSLPPFIPIPTVSQWGMIVLTLFLLSAASILVRPHRRTRVRYPGSGKSCAHAVSLLSALSMFSASTMAQTPNLNAPHHPEHLLVRFKAGVTDTLRAQVNTSVGALELRRYRFVDGLTLARRWVMAGLYPKPSAV